MLIYKSTPFDVRGLRSAPTFHRIGDFAGITYVNDAKQDQADIDAMRQALCDSNSVGNFQNLFLYAPDGNKDGVQVIPISGVAAKDEFLEIKGATRDAILAAHQMPP